MSWADDEWGKPFFPTRSGGATGHANERIMLDSVGGMDGIRTKIRTNADGSTTILKTRGGMPVFYTTKPVEIVIPPTESTVIYCVGAPVSYSYRSGYMDATVFTPMATPIAEESPGSAVITVGDGATTFEYNQRYSTKWKTDTFNEHPGNRNWKWKAKNKVISWWSPCPLSGSFTGSGYEYTNQLLGGTQQAKTDALGNYTGTFAAWEHNRGAIYINGEKAFVIPDNRWVYAAAAKEIDVAGVKQTVLLILASGTDPYRQFKLPDGPLRLMSYNVDTAAFVSNVATSAFTSYSNSPFIPNFAFNESATKVAYVANKYSADSLQTEAHIFEMNTTTGAETVVRRIAVPTPEERLFGSDPMALSGGYNAWNNQTAESSYGSTVSQDKVRGFYYTADTLDYAKVVTTRTISGWTGTNIEVLSGFDDSGAGGSRHEGRTYYSIGGAFNGLNYSLTCTTQASIGGVALGTYTLTHSVQASGAAGGEVQVPIYAGAYNFDSPVSGTGSFSVTTSGTLVDFAVVADDGSAVVIESSGSMNFVQTLTANRPAFGTMTSSISSTGLNGFSSSSTAYLRFSSGQRLDLPSGGDTYHTWQPLMTPGAGEYVYHGGISTSYDGADGIASVAALKMTDGQWQPIWTFTGAYTATGVYQITPEWPGSFAYIEAPIFIG